MVRGTTIEQQLVALITAVRAEELEEVKRISDEVGYAETIIGLASMIIGMISVLDEEHGFDLLGFFGLMAAQTGAGT